MKQFQASSDDKPMLHLKSVHASYGPIVALTDVSLTVCSGEIVALIGANGAGKSTLLMTVFGNPSAYKGCIVFEGVDITHFPTHDIARLGVAQVPEGRRVFSGMTVQENLAMGRVAISKEQRSQESDKQTLDKILHLFPLLRERTQQRAGTLSGGEQQMLAIGRALMSRPKLLLLDEPSLGLAPLIIRRIFKTLQAIAQEGTTIFLVEQNANQALRLANRAYVLSNGRIKLEGSGTSLLANPEVRKAYLGGH